jgi:short-subunit dehydrogenase
MTDEDTSTFRDAYGPWAVVAGASDGTGAELARELARRGVDVVLVARRGQLLEELASELDVETRVVPLDLSLDDAAERLWEATADLEVGLVVFNAGADDGGTLFLEQALDDLRSLVRRNCTTVMEVSHRFGGAMVERGRGGLILVSSGAAWAGASHVTTYGATKAFDLILAEGLWAEWRDRGVDVLGLVLGATDTPSLRRSLERHGGSFGELADPAEVAVTALDHLADGPTWCFGFPDPTGPFPLGGLPRRQAVELMSAASSAMHRTSG